MMLFLQNYELKTLPLIPSQEGNWAIELLLPQVPLLRGIQGDVDNQSQEGFIR
jgi:hypothetical protein